MKLFKKILITSLLLLLISSCASKKTKRIIRVAHNQANVHPTNLGFLAFEEYIESKLGDKYDVKVYPSELLGSQNHMVQLTQTGAIDICVASNALLESFEKNYEIFNLPYLFKNAMHYHASMNDPLITADLFEATKNSGFKTVTWFDAGTRSFYTVKKPIHSPDDLKGLKIRVQQSPTTIRMMELLGASATPLGFGEVYTALQAGIIDGAENNELALRDNGHGDIAKYYSYDMHQMVPDIVIANAAFLENLSEKEAAIFKEGFEIAKKVQNEEWNKAVLDSKDKALNSQGVEFIEIDQTPFQNAVLPLHQEVLDKNPEIKDMYERIIAKAKEY